MFLVVEKFPDANTVEVTDGVDAAIDAMRQGLATCGSIRPLYRPASFIESSFQNLGWALLAGGLLLLLVIGAIFWDWRRVLISVTAIAASLGAAAAVLYLRGTTVNLMVVAGLVLGLTAVIQDAIVDPSDDRPARRVDRERDSPYRRGHDRPRVHRDSPRGALCGPDRRGRGDTVVLPEGGERRIPPADRALLPARGRGVHGGRSHAHAGPESVAARQGAASRCTGVRGSAGCAEATTGSRRAC